MSPAAALRVLRIAAGRRALELVLLVGGLFVIGLLCGGQASAADGVSVAGVHVGTASTTGSKPEAPRRGEGLSVPAPVTEAGHLAGSVAEELAEAPSLPAAPAP
ncbi:hypothetical protein L0P92_42415, partial [Streptomyces muensis]|nr:hypothetical protein [Streptomyces muensis]